MYDQSAAHRRQKVGTLGFLFRALREQRLGDNNTFGALSHYVHEKGGLSPLERSLACMVPEARLEGPSLREAPGSGRTAPSPRSATNRPQACLLNAPRAHASSARKRGLKPPETLTCMYGARGETRTRTLLPTVDFESTASANSATRARNA